MADEVKDWSIPDENDMLHVPDDLHPLFNKMGFQFRFVTISGKNEAIAAAHCVQIAQKFFSEHPELLLKREDLEKITEQKESNV